VLTSFIRKELVELEVDKKNILVEADAVDLEKFNIDISKEEAREKLNLPKDKILLGYTGTIKTMGREKGVGLLIDCLRNLRANNFLIVVGGRNRDLIFYKEKVNKMGLSSRVIFIGQVGFDLIPYYQKAFDVLLAPYPNGNHYTYYMSPLKLFEYMASKRPIVTSDLPSIREVGDENSVILVEPNNPKKLAEGIKKVLENKDLADKISQQAFFDVQNYTWKKRVDNILKFIKII
ncbi:glycosyltransferase, partial [bacterium]|nr:glycosyltransferase [bacterium]